MSLAIGCARPEPVVPSRVLAGAQEGGLHVEDPLAVSPEIVAEVTKDLADITDGQEKLRALRDLLYTKSDRPFEYEPHVTLTAQGAYEQRRGDCMAFSMLFASLARALGLPVYFVHVRDVESYYERGGELFVSSHVAVGYGRGPDAKIYDFKKEITDWKLSLYHNIDDDSARALYLNNVAVDWMVAGRTDAARKLFEVLVARAPEVAEPYNNFGVLLIRTRDLRGALAVLDRAIAKFPSYKPLYTNAIVAADALGQPDRVAALDEGMQRIVHDDPIFVFGRGMRLLSRGAYAAAVNELSRAHDAMPDSAVILAGLGRAYIGTGDLSRGREALEEAKKTAAAPLRRQLDDKLSKLYAVRPK
jgi:tetratricopeptide (TPR) repeat protein